MTNGIAWLSEDEQTMWRRWLNYNADLLATLQRDMQQESGLSNPDYQVLSLLSEAPEDRLRVTELARQLQWDRSRLSHHLTRMAKRDLVTRRGCPDDGRGAFIRITDDGRAAVEHAAPGHVRTVRRLVFDELSPAEVGQLSDLLHRLQGRLDAPDGDR